MAVDVIVSMKESVLTPLSAALQNTVAAVPGLLYAVIVLLVGYLIAHFVGALVEKVLVRAKLERWVLEKTKLKPHVGALKLSGLLAVIIKWYVFILFLPPAANIINLEPLAMLLMKFAEWIPKAIIAILIALAGFIIADYVALKIRHTGAKGCKSLSTIGKAVVLVFTALLVLDQIGVEVGVAKNSFLIILGGVMLGAAIAFGLGLKDDVKKLVQEAKKKLGK